MKRCLVLLILSTLLLCTLFPASAQAASTAYYSQSYDGTLTSTGDNYTAVQESTSCTVEYSTSSFRVGQDNNTGTYYVYRSVLFFDTTELPTSAVISSASLLFYGKLDESDTNFNILLVEGGDVHSPMEVNDFGILHDKTTALSDAFGTASFSTTTWNTLVLNAAGLNAIQRDGITKFALRSSRDLATAPSGDEFVDIYSSESAYVPKLVITYTTAALPSPADEGSFGISYVRIFSSYIDSGDQLFCLRSDVSYNDTTLTEDLLAEDYFTIQLLDSTDNILASIPIWDWGKQPASLYLSAASAVDPAGSYVLKIIGNNDMFAAAVPSTTYTIESDNWKGDELTSLDKWIMLSARHYGSKHQNNSSYYIEEVLGDKVINDEGTVMFSSAIPEITTIRPHLFIMSSIYGNQDLPSGTSYSDTLWDHWGTTLGDAFDDAGNILGVDGAYVAGVLWLALGVVVVGVVQAELKKPLLGVLCCIPIFILGVWMGVPMALLLLAGGLATLYFWYDVLMTRT